MTTQTGPALNAQIFQVHFLPLWFALFVPMAPIIFEKSGMYKRNQRATLDLRSSATGTGTLASGVTWKGYM